MKRNVDQFINNPGLIVKSLNKTRNDYRPLDPGWYLYKLVCAENNFDKKFETPFIELIYVTLAAWNMNSRGAKLAKWDTFKKSLVENKDLFKKLSSYSLESITNDELNSILKYDIREMFTKIELVAKGKPKLVTYSKAFHFILPNLFVPIDRRYTLNYFYKNTNVPKQVDKQFLLFSEIIHEFRKLANAVNLHDKIDDHWNLNVPKVIDNAIIGSLR